MTPASKPRWQQAAALVSLGAGGAVTGFSFVPGVTADPAAPPITQIRLLALRQAAQAQPGDSRNSMLRAAIVNVAGYYLRLAATRSPAEMEALIWQRVSSDGADHGPSCAAFASLTLELAAQVVGQQSWVTGGSSYPWPVPDWADVRVDPNRASLQITSVLQDSQGRRRWHPLGDGYQPQAGDWAMFDGHVEVVTSYASGVLDTIGADSEPGFTVNAHHFSGPLQGHGVTGFVDNGDLADAPATAAEPPAGDAGETAPAARSGPATPTPAAGGAGLAAIPGEPAAGVQAGGGSEAAPPPAAAATLAPAVAPARVPQPSASASHAPASRAPGASRPRPTATAPSRHRRPAGAPASPAPAGSVGPASSPTPAASTAPADRHAPVSGPAAAAPAAADAAVPGVSGIPDGPAAGAASSAAGAGGAASVPGLSAATPQVGRTGTSPAAVSPGTVSPGTAAPPAAARPAAPARGATARPAAPAYGRHQSAPAAAGVPESPTQQAFIAAVAPGAIAAQRRYGVPAAVTIAQAIDESGWGQSVLAARDHNLFGIKGIGPAGSDRLPTSEFVNGQYVSITASFRVYRSFAESIDDHGRLLATSGYYGKAMSYKQNPNAFAASLTGVYATDPDYGAKVISLMSQYDLYRFDLTGQTPAAPAGNAASSPAPAAPSIPGMPAAGTGTGAGGASPAPSAAPPTASPAPAIPSPPPAPSPPAAPSPAPSSAPAAPPSPAPSPPASAPTAPSPADPAPAAPAAPAAQQQAGSRGAAQVPGLPAAPMTIETMSLRSAPAAYQSQPSSAAPAPGRAARSESARQAAGPAARPRRTAPAAGRGRPALYRSQLPQSVTTSFLTTARLPLLREEPLYRDVASRGGIRWELLAACDWMQCRARPRYSPVHGEKLGTVNGDGTVYRTRSEALEQCAEDLADLAWAVYRIDVCAPAALSVLDLANVFAAFRWGGLLRLHHTSAMEFPYSVAGLTDRHAGMRWPNIAEPNTPDKPGTRFRMPFGAVPVVLGLDYPALA